MLNGLNRGVGALTRLRRASARREGWSGSGCLAFSCCLFFFFLAVTLCHGLLRAGEVSDRVENSGGQVVGVQRLESVSDIPKFVRSGRRCALLGRRRSLSAFIGRCGEARGV